MSNFSINSELQENIASAIGGMPIEYGYVIMVSRNKGNVLLIDESKAAAKQSQGYVMAISASQLIELVGEKEMSDSGEAEAAIIVEWMKAQA